MKGGQDTAHRRLLDVRKMLRHSVSFAGGLRQFIKRRFLIVEVPSQILVTFFGEIADNVFLGWQLRRRRVKAIHPALQKCLLLSASFVQFFGHRLHLHFYDFIFLPVSA